MKLLLITLICLCTFHGWSQTQHPFHLIGCIADKDSRQVLPGARITFFNAINYAPGTNALTNTEGCFNLLFNKPGKYRLDISYLGYTSLERIVEAQPSDTTINLDTLFLQKKVITLKLVEIREIRPPMTVKKDTLEFNAEAFKTKENALLKELLERLPGVHVEKDGTLTAHGQTIKKVFIEGQQFFDGEPSMAIENLQADIVDKVQLVDKKSERSEFTGVNDQNTEKVLNIIVKEEKKNKFTGRLAAGVGTDQRFASNAVISRFNNKEQISLVASGNNVNDAGFLEGGSSRVENGISRNWNEGITYSKSFNEKLQVTSSYVLNADHLNNYRNSTRRNMLADSTYYYNQISRSLDKNTKHKMTTHLEYKPDSLHTLIADANLNFVKMNNKAENSYESLNTNQEPINSGSIYNSKSETNPGGFITIFLAKKFRKQGRSLSSFFSLAYQGQHQKSFNRSYNMFKNPDETLYRDTLDQSVKINSFGRSLMASMSFTEPVFKDHYLDITYAYSGNYAATKKLTYDYDAVNGNYNRLNDSLTNSFNTRNQSHLLRIGINGRMQKSDYGIGLNIAVTMLDNTDITSKQHLEKAAKNFYPNAFLNYSFNKNKSLRVTYTGFVQVPAVEQLQPVPDNSNPLYIRQGNPDLKMTFTHNSLLGYTAVDPLTLRSLSINITASLINNKIISSSSLDTLGRQITRPLNVNGAYNIKTNIVNAFPLKKANTIINATTWVNLNRDISFINGIKGNIYNLTLTQQLSTSYYYKELFDMSVSGSMSYSRNSYSMRQEGNAKYFTYALAFSGNLNLLLGFKAGINVDYQLNTGRAAGYNTTITLLNAYIAKSVLPHKQGLIKLHGFDMLNQNKSINRNLGENYIEDVQHNVLQRFFMASFTYYLDRDGGKAPGN